ncbi:MAG: MFS transporter, partial [Candidatus Methylomirabilis sp.]|nr:MFS transporter [Deltaproteobacteria bacterium]
ERALVRELKEELGIDVTESAAAAGDEYDTRAILLAEGVATLAAGFTGGVAQTTPYIGHPAYKEMGGRSGYTLLTALFIGLGGVFGFLQFIVDVLPKAAVAPIIVFIGVEITAQAFVHTKKEHAPAVAFSFLPTLAALVMIQFGQLLPAVGRSASDIGGEMAATFGTMTVLANGFILTSLLWGGALAHLIDHRLREGALYIGLCAVFSLFGLIHSPLPGGDLFLPWTLETTLPYRLAIGYGLMAAAILAVGAGSRLERKL